MNKLLNIAFNLPLYETYDYVIRENLANVKVGMRVRASFGRKKYIGIINEIKNEENLENKKYKLKEIDEIIDTKPILTKEIIKLCKWSSNYYQYPLGQVYFSCIPSTLKQGKASDVKKIDYREFFYKVTDIPFRNYFKNKRAQKRIYDYIKEKEKLIQKTLNQQSHLKSY